MELKFLSHIILIFSIASAGTIPGLLIGLLSVILLQLLSKLTLTKTVAMAKAPLLILAAMSPFIILMPGTPFIDRIVLIMRIALKSLSVFMTMALLINNRPPAVLAGDMKKMGVPVKLITILISTYRYINLYTGDLKQLLTAARIRGFSAMKGISHIKTSADILLVLLIRSYEQSERVEAAMTSRGFRGELPYSAEREETSVRDRLQTLIALLFPVIIIIMEHIC